MLVIVLRRFMWFFLRGLGIPDGEPAAFYKDVALAILFIPASIAVALRIDSYPYDSAFWICALTGTMCIFLATEKLALFAAALSFISIRFIIAGTVTARPLALFCGIVLGIVVLGLFRWRATKGHTD
jgi:hypothetical protein